MLFYDVPNVFCWWKVWTACSRPVQHSDSSTVKLSCCEGCIVLLKYAEMLSGWEHMWLSNLFLESSPFFSSQTILNELRLRRWQRFWMGFTNGFSFARYSFNSHLWMSQQTVSTNNLQFWPNDFQNGLILVLKQCCLRVWWWSQASHTYLWPCPLYTEISPDSLKLCLWTMPPSGQTPAQWLMNRKEKLQLIWIVLLRCKQTTSIWHHIYVFQLLISFTHKSFSFSVYHCRFVTSGATINAVMNMKNVSFLFFFLPYLHPLKITLISRSEVFYLFMCAVKVNSAYLEPKCNHMTKTISQ